MGEKEVLVRYKGRSDPFFCIKGKTYKKIAEEHGYWRIIDESGEDYLYWPDVFDVVESDD